VKEGDGVWFNGDAIMTLKVDANKIRFALLWLHFRQFLHSSILLGDASRYYHSYGCIRPVHAVQAIVQAILPDKQASSSSSVAVPGSIAVQKREKHPTGFRARRKTGSCSIA
jgi:hypothetical protein